jgi:hypothetical protein
VRQEFVGDHGGIGFDFDEVDGYGGVSGRRGEEEGKVPMVGISPSITRRQELAKARSQLERATCACLESASLIVI